ncbi:MULTISPECIES: hypothetical protein [Microbacterium]|jgi:hypothetical protein|uniref:Uncharacterized protein n=1 Tax=Microbacterium schleiferi TaxID=69362 RepID=A0ABU7V329_9MICO|nr:MULTISPECIES: hypothetical protein [Microbacterium]MCC4266779.1 hypothetical protein [Microbacterium schleiferi]|tara:strand:+ start:1440 stop:1577 length:138 start_codon:yes stop_codon:yes gene_type:complete
MSSPYEPRGPRKSRNWLLYIGVALLASGVGVLVYAAFMHYAAAIR